MNIGVEQITKERGKQVSKWGVISDRQFTNGELITAGIAYALAAKFVGEGMPHDAIRAQEVGWPWDEQHWHPEPTVQENLAKSGALLAADIDRLETSNLPAKVFAWAEQMAPSGSGSENWGAMAIANDGTHLAGHICSSKSWATRDMQSDDKLEKYKKHYPHGYEFIWVDNPEADEAFREAFERNQGRTP